MKLKVGNSIDTVPDGTYELIIRKIEQSTVYKRPCLVFMFEVATGKFKGSELKGFCNVDYETFSNRTKIYQWYFIVTGDELEHGDSLDTEDFIAKVIEAKVVTKTSRRTKMEFSNVTEILKVVGEV